MGKTKLSFGFKFYIKEQISLSTLKVLQKNKMKLKV